MEKTMYIPPTPRGVDVLRGKGAYPRDGDLVATVPTEKARTKWGNKKVSQESDLRITLVVQGSRPWSGNLSTNSIDLLFKSSGTRLLQTHTTLASTPLFANSK